MVEWAGVLGKCKGSIKTADTGVAAGSDKMISISKCAAFTWRLAKQREQVHWLHLSR